MGVVYKAEETRVTPIAALKSLLPGLARYPEDKGHFAQEAQAR
jgi:hypothetical protein